MSKLKNKQPLKKREYFSLEKLKTLYPDGLNQELNNIDWHETLSSAPPPCNSVQRHILSRLEWQTKHKISTLNSKKIIITILHNILPWRSFWVKRVGSSSIVFTNKFPRSIVLFLKWTTCTVTFEIYNVEQRRINVVYFSVDISNFR